MSGIHPATPSISDLYKNLYYVTSRAFLLDRKRTVSYKAKKERLYHYDTKRSFLYDTVIE